MKLIRPLIGLFCILIHLSCQPNTKISIVDFIANYNKKYPPIKSGWNNLYKGNSMLSGIAISQVFPEGSSDPKLYLGKHPAGISYYFWDGTCIEYWYFKNQSGNVSSIEIKHNYSDVSADEWKWVDFSYGSDPTLEKHKDPRIAGLCEKIDKIKIRIITEDMCNGRIIKGEITVYDGKSVNELDKKE